MEPKLKIGMLVYLTILMLIALVAIVVALGVRFSPMLMVVAPLLVIGVAFIVLAILKLIRRD
ncbi:MAG: hypothetical protein SOS98_01965 [Varibaculum sp.]|nr:hypothetical protein [Varibaculum sp.]